MHGYKHILFSTDFSEAADFAFDFAVDLANRYDAALHVLHVLPELAAQFWRGYVDGAADIENKTRAEIDAKFAAYAGCVPAGREIKAVVRFGKPGEEILDYAKSAGADLIVLGRQRHVSIFSGNTAMQVAKAAECPVLVLPLEFKRRVKAREVAT